MNFFAFLSQLQAAPIDRRTFLTLSCLATTGSFFFPEKGLAHSAIDQRAKTYQQLVSKLPKAKDPDKSYPGDIWACPEQMLLIYSCYNKLSQVQRRIGFSNFNYVDFPTVIRTAAQQRRTGRYFKKKAECTIPFTRDEAAFMEQVFAFDAKAFGFHGQKVIHSQNYRVNPKNLTFMDGHFIRKGEALEKYSNIRNQMSEKIAEKAGKARRQQSALNMQITSGIRNIPKQMRLFFRKGVRLAQVPQESSVVILDYRNNSTQRVEVYDLKNEWKRFQSQINRLMHQHLPANLKKDERKSFLLDQGFHLINLSAVSRSLAPPGYSWHAKHDFDIGLRSGKFKPYNFRKEFILTPLFIELFSNGAIHLQDLRYQQDNNLGVRFEPWHIRVGKTDRRPKRIKVDLGSLFIPNRESTSSCLTG